MYEYVKALHIIFIVTWFSGMFYIVRLFIYNTEAGEMEDPAKSILRKQFTIMIKRLWLGITVPSAFLTLCLGPWMLLRWTDIPTYMWLKLAFVVGLYLYFFSLQNIYKQQMSGIFKYTSTQLRIWNEVATVFLFAIVMLVVVKQGMSMVWGMVGLFLFIIILMSAIKIYKLIRAKQ